MPRWIIYVMALDLGGCNDVSATISQILTAIAQFSLRGGFVAGALHQKL